MSIFSDFSIRAENWKECCIFELTQEMLLRCFWTQDLSEYSELSEAFELINTVKAFEHLTFQYFNVRFNLLKTELGSYAK